MDLQEISDRLEITDVITRYTRAFAGSPASSTSSVRSPSSWTATPGVPRRT